MGGSLPALARDGAVHPMGETPFPAMNELMVVRELWHGDVAWRPSECRWTGTNVGEQLATIMQQSTMMAEPRTKMWV